MENITTPIGNIDFLEQVSHACGGALLVSEARAAELVNVSVKTLRNLRLQGKERICTCKLGGRRMVRTADLAAWLASCQPNATPAPAPAPLPPARFHSKPDAVIRSGRPTKREQAQAEAVGLSVREFRKLMLEGSDASASTKKLAMGTKPG